MKIIICNAFSLSMLDRNQQSSFEGVRTPRPIDEGTVIEFVEAIRAGHFSYESAVGHADTAKLFENLLGLAIPPNRVSVRLDNHTRAIVGQYVGPRLPEGATTLPEGSSIEWWIV